MLNLDEAIEHCEEKAEELERSAKLHQRPDRSVKGSGKRYLSCIECAKEHRQLAEWLKKLKAYKEERVSCEYCKYNDRLEHERPCSLCKHNFKDMFEGSDGE
jgi:hypothetical protein